MHMADFSTDLQQSTAWFHRPTMDPTPKYHHHQESLFAGDCEDRLSASEPAHPAPVSPYDKDSMFEKSLTPSDVGKLNRLVIPKQHAEKYFPLGGDVAGTLLGFEDEAGKCWRFRYSYWNSSQSYVLTKGWSRYVKEKRLDAGDVVFFERHRADPERLFIGWRRRGAPPPQPASTAFHYNAQGYPMAQDSRGRALGLSQYQADCSHSGAVQDKQEQKGTPGSSTSNGNPRRLVRLFGVNLECQLEDSSSQTTSSEGSSSLSSQHQQNQQQQRQAYNAYFNHMGYPAPPNHHHHYQMDMNFTQGVNQMGNRLG